MGSRWFCKCSTDLLQPWPPLLLSKRQAGKLNVYELARMGT